MGTQRTLLGLVITVAAVGTAGAEPAGTLRWRAGTAPLGLQAGGAEARLPCTSYTLACNDTATVPLYASGTVAVSLQARV